MLSLVGDIVRVQVVTSDATRGYPVEDTVAMVFTFANGALGTFLLSDTAASPRSWEQTSRENHSYDSHPDEDCYHIVGTRGSLSVPTMRLKVYEGAASWCEPLTSSVVDVMRTDPLANQLNHFRRRHPRRGAAGVQWARRPEDPAGRRGGGPLRQHRAAGGSGPDQHAPAVSPLIISTAREPAPRGAPHGESLRFPGNAGCSGPRPDAMDHQRRWG